MTKNQNYKISVLGCGWSGLPLAAHLAQQGYTVKGSTTRMAKLTELAFEGILPFVITTGLKLEGERINDFFHTDLLVVTLPPPKMAGIPDFHLHAHRAIARMVEQKGIKRVILFSSTSVYPDQGGLVIEDDAQRLLSPHSGVAMLDIENCYAQNEGFETTVLRFGGLTGPGRHPGRFVSGKEMIKNSENAVNMTHLDDIIGACRFIIENKSLSGPFNVCSPTKLTRGEFYTKALQSLGNQVPPLDRKGDNGKIVSADKLIRAGYNFAHPRADDWITIA